MMFAIQRLLLKGCLFGAYISLSGAAVTLKTGDGQSSYQEGSTVQLVCTINPYNNEITWLIDNDAHADCFLGICGPYPNKPTSFMYTFDESAGIFNLTIDKVNISHADLEFACDDGNERKTIKFNVTTVTNEGNGDNDDRTLGEGAIAGIVVAIVIAIAVIIVVYLCKRAKKKREAEVNSKPEQSLPEIEKHEAKERLKKLERQMRKEIEKQEAEERLKKLERQMRREQSVIKSDIKEKIEVWMNDPGNCCIIMKGLLRIGVLFEEIVKQTGILLKESDKKRELCDEIQEEEIQRIELKEQTQHHFTVGQRKQERELMQKRLEWITEPSWMEVKNLEGNGTDAVSKMKKLVDNTTFSVFVMKGFVKEKPFFDYMISQLQENRKIYENIGQEIALKTKAKDVERENWQYR